LPTIKLPMMKKTEPIKPYVTKPSLHLTMKSDNIKKLLPLWPHQSLITKTYYNKPKLTYNKLNTIMKKLLPPSKPELPKELLNTKLGLMKITKTPSKLPL